LYGCVFVSLLPEQAWEQARNWLRGDVGPDLVEPVLVGATNLIDIGKTKSVMGVLMSFYMCRICMLKRCL